MKDTAEDTNVPPPGPVPGPAFQLLLLTADDPVLSTTEIAEELPIGKRAVLQRLQDLRESGYVKGKKAGGKVWVWWPPDNLVEGHVKKALEVENYQPPDDKGDIPSHSAGRAGKNWAKIYAINKHRRERRR